MLKGLFIFKICFLALIVSHFLNISCLAKEILSLRDTIERALKSNIQISIALKQKEEFFFQKSLIRAEFFPKLYLSYTFERRDLGKNLPTRDSHLFGPTFTWNIFSGFSTYFSFKEAIHYLYAQDENIRHKILEISLMVIRNYINYFKQRALLEASLADLEDAKTLLRLAQRRYELGLSPYADVLDAEARLKEAEFKVTNYKYSADIAKAKVLLLLNENLTQIDAYEFQPLDFNDIEIIPLSQHIDKALKLRPEIKYKEREIQAQRERINSVRGEYFPTIDLFTSYYRQDKNFFPTQNYQFLAGIRINFPLFTGFSTPSKLQKERATLEKKHLEKRSLELQIQEEVFTAYNVFLTSRENLSVSRALLTKMEEDYRLVRKKYENGLASIVDVTTILARLSQARTQFTNSKFDLIFNYYQLKRVTGEIPGI
ncbi:MAG: TolC family protein [Caldimicrobium sp.]|nr:TolC family protein [Caldimicrobium sp.]MCX7872848.1 TolC family protein [Caldimicrobium sp.]MDW8093573.1 TolC family protein [Caldimicrobium sp.]